MEAAITNSQPPGSPPQLPQVYDPNMDYVINDYMERLGTRLNILESELKYAWRALDLLSQEYVKMWERLEKLEGLIYEQQNVISQLLEFYSTSGPAIDAPQDDNASQSIIDSRIGQLEVIREILGNGTVEDGLEEGVDVTRNSVEASELISELELEMGLDEMCVPDEAFYRSLNQAYRDDLVCGDTSRPQSQLGLIWEETEEGEDGIKKDIVKELQEAAMLEDENQQVFSAMDYKDYRGNSPCISEQDLAQLSRISSLDHVAIEKLNELDRLTTKLQKDSDDLKDLQNQLMDSPHMQRKKLLQDEAMTEAEARALADDTSIIDEQLKQMYTEKWSYTNGTRGFDDMLQNLSTALTNNSNPKRSNSRLSISDSISGADAEVAETLSAGFRTPTSPRRRLQMDITTCDPPYTTVTGRLAYSNALQNAEANVSSTSINKTATQVLNDYKKFQNEYMDSQLSSVSCKTIPCTTPTMYNTSSEKTLSPTLSICSIRTRQDGYVDPSTSGVSLDLPDMKSSPSRSPSPPPPAPGDAAETFLMPESSILPGPQRGPSPVFLGANVPNSTSISNVEPHQQGRLSPRNYSPKSPRASPKHNKSNSTNIVAAKSDSGLSSMSGWSSLEKSPGSPKGAIVSLNKNQSQTSLVSDTHLNKNQQHMRPVSPMPHQIHPTPIFPKENSQFNNSESYNGPLQVPVCNAILPGGHHLSAFTTVKSPCSLESSEGYGNFVPAPAPCNDRNVSPRKKLKHPSTTTPQTTIYGDYMYRNEQPAIYSVAGTNKQEAYTSVYTSNSATYVAQPTNYPDLIGNNEAHISRFPPEPSYHAHTTICTVTTTTPSAHTGNRKPLTRGHSMSAAIGSESITNHDGYKTAMYRTMFPTGNITDALSYYPTSTRYDQIAQNLPKTDYNDPAAWLNYTGDNPSQPNQSNVFTSSKSFDCSQPYVDPRRLHQIQQMQDNTKQIPPQPIYENQMPYQPNQSYNQPEQYGGNWNKRPDLQYLELDLRNRNVPEQMVRQQGDQFYDSGGVIVSQSGYISISSDLKESGHEDKSTKKLKRGSTLKSAMNSVSNWLPDLHLSKRHRSHSLPSGVKREDLIQKDPNRTSVSTKSSRNSVAATPRKKKRYPLVSTVSGILQKAKRRTQHHSQSLSDPEQSETEWSGGRSPSIAQSEDEDNVFPDNIDSLFAKVSTVNLKSSTQNLQINEQQVENDVSQDQQPLFAKMLPPTQLNVKSGSKNETESELSDNVAGEEETSGKSTGSASSAIFATIGDVKKGASSEKSDDSTTSETRPFPPVTLGGASMEFAVSRALGKYRQRQSSTVSEDQTVNEDNGQKGDESIIYDEVAPPEPEPFIPKKTEPINIIDNHKPTLDDAPPIEGSPSAVSARSHTNRFFPRHQQSLEIPGSRDEDDNRSTHSWRSGSRVSSRRQSTEDSIDSEDEWYCYELRKLEEMERQSQIENEMVGPLAEEPEDEPYEPNIDVKERMSFVLRELRMKVKPKEGVLDENELYNNVIASAKRREEAQRRKSDAKADLFARIKDYHSWAEESFQMEEPKEVEKPEETEEHSSGETSGPDSPNQSIDESDEEEMAAAEALASRSRRSSSGSTLRQHERIVQSDSLSREGSVSVPPSEVSVSVPPSEGWDSEETATIRDERAESAGTTTTATVSLPKIKIDSSCSSSPGNKQQDDPQSGPLSSKWKLLKALKERKAEERSNQEKIQDTVTTKEEKVSMMSMMQKFYEIHVKT